jgi:quercetin dioxygenase-like cupin family protein
MSPAPTTILLRAEDTAGEISIVENTLEPGAPGPPLHHHAFDEAFYILEGELTFQVEDDLLTAGPGELGFAPRGVAHTLANRSGAPARYLLVCTPAGFERVFARRIAKAEGTDPPDWALAPTPEVTVVGPRIGDRDATQDPR